MAHFEKNKRIKLSPDPACQSVFAPQHPRRWIGQCVRSSRRGNPRFSLRPIKTLDKSVVRDVVQQRTFLESRMRNGMRKLRQESFW